MNQTPPPFVFNPLRGVVQIRSSVTPAPQIPNTETEVIACNLSKFLSNLKGLNYSFDFLNYFKDVSDVHKDDLMQINIAPAWERLLQFMLSIFSSFKPEHEFETFAVYFRIINENVVPNVNVLNESKKALILKSLIFNWYDCSLGDLKTFQSFIDEYKRFVLTSLPAVFKTPDLVTNVYGLGNIKDYLNRRMSNALEDLLRKKKVNIPLFYKFVELIFEMKNCQILSTVIVREGLTLDKTLNEILVSYFPEIKGQLAALKMKDESDPIDPIKSSPPQNEGERASPPPPLKENMLKSNESIGNALVSPKEKKEVVIPAQPQPSMKKKKKSPTSLEQLRALSKIEWPPQNLNDNFFVIANFFQEAKGLSPAEVSELRTLLVHLTPQFEKFTQKQIDKLSNSYQVFNANHPGLNLVDFAAIQNEKQVRKVKERASQQPRSDVFEGTGGISRTKSFAEKEDTVAQPPKSQTPTKGTLKEKKKYLQSPEFVPSQNMQEVDLTSSKTVKPEVVKASEQPRAFLTQVLSELPLDYRDRLDLQTIGSFGGNYESDITTNVNFALKPKRVDLEVKEDDLLKKLGEKISEKGYSCLNVLCYQMKMLVFEFPLEPGGVLEEEKDTVRAAAKSKGPREMKCTVIYDPQLRHINVTAMLSQCFQKVAALRYATNFLRKNVVNEAAERFRGARHNQPLITTYQLTLILVKALQLRGVLGTFDKDQDATPSKMSFEEMLRCFNDFVQQAKSDEKFIYSLENNERVKGATDALFTIIDPADGRTSVFQELRSSSEANDFLIERLNQLQLPR